VTDPITVTPDDGVPYLAVDVQPDNLAGTFTLDVSELDGPDVLAWTAGAGAGVWVNIICDVQTVVARTGAARVRGVLTRAEAGTVVLTAIDTAGELDPMTNGDAIHKGTPLRVRAWGYTLEGDRWESVLWTGEVDESSAQYLKNSPPLVTMTGVDLIGVLTAWSSEGRPEPGVGAGDHLRQRVARALTEADRGTIAADSDSTYEVTLAPTTLANPWENISRAADAELGRVWVDRSNRLVVRSRGSELSGPVRGTLSDVHGEAVQGVHCCVADAVIRYSPELLTNRAIAGRRLPPGDESEKVLERRDDTYSQARYGVGVVDDQDLELETDAQLAPWAKAVVVSGARPELRVDSVTPAPSDVDLDSALRAWPAVMATGIGDRWLFRYRTHTGRLVKATLGVLGVELDLSPGSWSVVWATTEAPAPGRAGAAGWFVLDASELGGTDLLAPYAVPVRSPV